MSALEPISDISLEHYADLAAKMANCGGDLEVCAQIAEQNGVDRARWQAAMDGWNSRMQSPTTAAEVAMAYMPLYQAALARTGASSSCSFEDYVGMSAMISAPSCGLDRMYAQYNLDTPKWSQISTHWVGELTADQSLAARFGDLKGQWMTHLAGGGALPQPEKSSY